MADTMQQFPALIGEPVILFRATPACTPPDWQEVNDTFILSTFAITHLVNLANVCLRWLKNSGNSELVNTLDFKLLYPMVYVGSCLLMFVLSYTGAY